MKARAGLGGVFLCQDSDSSVPVRQSRNREASGHWHSGDETTQHPEDRAASRSWTAAAVSPLGWQSKHCLCFIPLQHNTIIISKTSRLIVLSVLFSLAEEPWNSLLRLSKMKIYLKSLCIYLGADTICFIVLHVLSSSESKAAKSGPEVKKP